MVPRNREVVTFLEDLVETCRDGEHEFRRAASKLADGATRARCDRYSRLYARFATELEREVDRLGGLGRGPRSNELEEPGWIHLAHKGTGEDESCLKIECELGESAGLRSYEEVLARELPADLRSVVERQYLELKRTYERTRGAQRFQSAPSVSGSSR